MLGALQDLLDWRHKIGDVSRQLVEADYLVGGKLFPLRVDVFALVTQESAGTAVARRFSFLALVAFGFGQRAHLFEDVLDIEQVVDEEGSLQAGDSVLGQRGELATVGALHDLSLLGLACQWLEAVLTEDMEALEQLGVCVGLQTYCTGQLFIQFFKSLLRGGWEFSHISLATQRLHKL